MDTATPYQGAGNGAHAMAAVPLYDLRNVFSTGTISVFTPTPANIVADPINYGIAAGFLAIVLFVAVAMYTVGHMFVYLCCTCRCKCCCCPPLLFDKKLGNIPYVVVLAVTGAAVVTGWSLFCYYDSQVDAQSLALINNVNAIRQLQTDGLQQAQDLYDSVTPAIRTMIHFNNTALRTNYSGSLQQNLGGILDTLETVQQTIHGFIVTGNQTFSVDAYESQARRYLWWAELAGYGFPIVALLLIAIQVTASFACARPVWVCQAINEIVSLLFFFLAAIVAIVILALLTALSHGCTPSAPAAFAVQYIDNSVTEYYLNCNGQTANPLHSTFDQSRQELQDFQGTLASGLALFNNSDLVALQGDCVNITRQINSTEAFLSCGHVTPILVDIEDQLCGSWFDALFEYALTLGCTAFLGNAIYFCLMPRAPPGEVKPKNSTKQTELTPLLA
jgi:hypothetical protein